MFVIFLLVFLLHVGPHRARGPACEILPALTHEVNASTPPAFTKLFSLIIFSSFALIALFTGGSSLSVDYVDFPDQTYVPLAPRDWPLHGSASCILVIFIGFFFLSIANLSVVDPRSALMALASSMPLHPVMGEIE